MLSSMIYAQNSRVQYVNGKITNEQAQRQNKVLTLPSGSNFIEGLAGDKDVNTEKIFSEQAIKRASNEIYKAKPEFVMQADGRIMSPSENKSLKSLIQNDVQRKDVEFKPFVSVRKTDRDDVATVTLKVIGDPWGDGSGFQMLLDADHILYDNYFNDVYVYWEEIYKECDYFIPEDAECDPSTPNIILDGEGSVKIPEGTYDFMIVNPFYSPYWSTFYIATWAETDEPAIIDDFLFKAGYEYVFQVEIEDLVEFYGDLDANLTKINLPLPIVGLLNGTPKTSEALRLPVNVKIKTNQGNKFATVSWNVAACSYNPDLPTKQTFIVTGNVSLPEGVINPNGIPLTVEIDVTVSANFGNHDVYVGGYDGNYKATVWKNGTPQYLSDNGEINVIKVVGEDVYAAGTTEGETVGKVWKNGTVLHTLEGPACNAIFITGMEISGSDVYVTTIEFSTSWQVISRLWKNGVAQNGYDDASEMGSVFIEDGDIYVAGRIDNIGVIWKNEIPLYTYVSEFLGFFASLFVADGDVYYVGGDYGGGMGKSTITNNYDVNDFGIKAWKNGEILYMLGEEVNGGSLYFSDGILYVAGQVPNETGNVMQAKVWIDGVGTVLSDIWGAAESIFVLNGDVYVAGFYGIFPELDAVIWKNSEASVISTGGWNMANSIFVVDKNTNINEFTIDNGQLIIYPNPATSELRMENGELRIEKITVHNTAGQLIISISNVNTTSYSLNTERLNSGIYFISVQTNGGVVNKKFVVKR